jgi:primosomal protein N' (replication factor Y)
LLTALQRSAGLAWADWLLVESGARREDLTWLADQEWLAFGSAARWRDPLSETDYVVKSAPTLTDDQQRAWDALAAEPRGAFVLRGVDGSGKTEIYMCAIAAAIARGAGAIVLVPEIDLAPHLARRFLERFPGRVALIHSRLTAAERFSVWRRIRSGELSVVVGARSALFAPLPNIGLIVIDQEHDDSYKQLDHPYVDARRAAQAYAAQLGAGLILGSATPTLEAMHSVECGAATLLDLPQRVRVPTLRLAAQGRRLRSAPAAVAENDAISSQPLPRVEVVDMRAELRAGNTSMFGRAMAEGLAETLARREQAILFLNRRGAGSVVSCRDCGHVLRCARDDSPLAWHGEDLRCHVCSQRRPMPERCPACGGRRLRHFGAGTQTVEEEVRRRFPLARVLRIDRDAASTPGAVEQIVKRFAARQADVLIGAKRIARGIDLPLASFVGVVLADVGLFLPDFRASERALRLLESVAARAGRSLQAGRVVVQTYDPDHPALRAAATHDVDGFAQRELVQRRRLRLPPYTRLVQVLCTAPSEEAARALAAEAAARARRVAGPEAVIGPASCYFLRRAGRARWQVLIRTDDPRALLSQFEAPRGATVVVDPVSVL